MIETGASHANRKSAFGRRIGSAVAIVFAGLLLVATTTSGPAAQGDSRSETRAEPARSEQGRDTPPVPVQPLAPGQPASVTETAFSRARLIETAEAMARRPYQDRSGEVPDALLSLSYDQYRDIRYRPEATIWLNGDRTFSIDLMPAGFVFAQPVDVWLVENGKAARLGFDPGNYDLGPTVAGRMPDAPVPLSGFRLRYPVNAPGVQDEVAVFQGASYFRAVGAGEHYGLSARGLAIDTARPEGEEFPMFRSFWIERPPENAVAVVVHALLDSPSATGVYRFTLRPGDATVTDVELVLFPRRNVEHVGLAPFSAMFLYDGINRSDFVDYRAAVHDTEGLSIWSGNGSFVWRPLDNPERLRISAFQETGPRGFGLVQRKRDFTDFQDAEARYELRPSAWVEPVGDWGRGAVMLYEIPTAKETNDNIVAFWKPQDGLREGEQYNLTYRIHWDALPPAQAAGPRVKATRIGLGRPYNDGDLPLFVVDYRFDGEIPAGITARAESSAGQIVNMTHYRIPEPGVLRISFELDPQGATEAELRLDLAQDDRKAGETWLYRWTE